MMVGTFPFLDVFLSPSRPCGKMWEEKGGDTMSDNVSLNAFPRNKIDALAVLYVQAQDLSGKTPEDLAVMYETAYAKIKERFKDMRSGEICFN